MQLLELLLMSDIRDRSHVSTSTRLLVGVTSYLELYEIPFFPAELGVKRFPDRSCVNRFLPYVIHSRKIVGEDRGSPILKWFKDRMRRNLIPFRIRICGINQLAALSRFTYGDQRTGDQSLMIDEENSDRREDR